MRSSTLEEALLRTLEVRSRLIETKLVLFTQLRFQRDTKAEGRPSERAVKAVLADAVKRKLVVRLADGRYELGRRRRSRSRPRGLG
ncbi:hypothetical protein [Nannocystis pusilla]|uniref:hypothetical protein n=1 Tax=Nannocystis pusilla TaxID=889268 RepID=UPI003B812A36